MTQPVNKPITIQPQPQTPEQKTKKSVKFEDFVYVDPWMAECWPTSLIVKPLDIDKTKKGDS